MAPGDALSRRGQRALRARQDLGIALGAGLAKAIEAEPLIAGRWGYLITRQPAWRQATNAARVAALYSPFLAPL